MPAPSDPRAGLTIQVRTDELEAPTAAKEVSASSGSRSTNGTPTLPPLPFEPAATPAVGRAAARSCAASRGSDQQGKVKLEIWPCESADWCSIAHRPSLVVRACQPRRRVGCPRHAVGSAAGSAGLARTRGLGSSCTPERSDTAPRRRPPGGLAGRRSVPQGNRGLSSAPGQSGVALARRARGSRGARRRRSTPGSRAVPCGQEPQPSARALRCGSAPAAGAPRGARGGQRLPAHRTDAQAGQCSVHGGLLRPAWAARWMHGATQPEEQLT
eukprot:scaffold12523_cov125-Isochrysis_galbana.AAC.2